MNPWRGFGWRPALATAGLVVGAALLPAACGSGAQDGSPGRPAGGGEEAVSVQDTAAVGSLPAAAVPPGLLTAAVPSVYEVEEGEAVSLEEGVEMLDESDAEIIYSGISREPRGDLPDHALSWAAFGLSASGDSPDRASGFLVANFWPTRLAVNVICLVDGGQVPCSDEADVWRVELDEPGMAVLDLPEPLGRRDTLLVEEGDQRVERVRPTSWPRPVDGWDLPISEQGDPPPEVVNPLGGCDWVLFMDHLEPREFFTPMRYRPSGPVYMVVSVCPEHESYEMLPLVVLDETTVARVEEFRPFMARPGAAYAWRVPDELLDEYGKVRGAVVRRYPAGGVWMTHPLVPARGSG